MEEGIKRERQKKIVSFIKALVFLKEIGMCSRSDTPGFRESLYKGIYQYLTF